MITGSILIGLGYGLTNPPSAVLLARATSIYNRGLIFSLKQSGVPLGGVIAAVSTPLLTESFHWRIAAYAVGIVCFITLIIIRTLGKQWGKKGQFKPSENFQEFVFPKLNNSIKFLTKKAKKSLGRTNML